MMRNQLLMLLHGENYNKEEVIHEIAMKKDKKIPLGRKSNPYGKRQSQK